ncbi:hypothetical protein ACFYWP_35025 [Actinacidiphila glaucinigra]|uniref:hypothetical protein n=1 Tax=Actinacidiphila glaucinigra TaxID=235986 RepID=UPI00367973E7
MRSARELADGDFRKSPRFAPDALEHDLDIVAVVEEVAAEVGAPPAQVALGNG